MRVRVPGLTSIAVVVCLAFCGLLAADDEGSPESSALFDVIRKNGGDLPASFGAFREVMDPAVTLAIPDGRSLQKKKADFADPRIVMTRGDSKLFVGYAAKAKQAEVISWNEKTRQYDFFVIRNLGTGLKPELARPERSACLSCHQAGGPIFSRAPWDESTISQPLRDEHGQIRRLSTGELMDGNELYKKLVAANGGSTNFDGVDIDRISVTLPSAYDRGVRVANFRLQGVRACQEMCGPSLECRQLLAQGALSSLSAAEKARLQSLLEPRWPADGFAYASSVIPNRDPTVDPEHGGRATRIIVPDAEKVRRYDRTTITVRVGSGDPFHPTFHNEQRLANGDPNDPNTLAFFAEQAIAHALPSPEGPEVTYDEPSSSTGGEFSVGCRDCDSPESRGLVKYVDFPATDGSAADPLVPRPKVGGVPVDQAAKFAAEQLSFCLGFTDADRQLLARYTPDQLKAALAAPKLQELLGTWPPDRGSFVRALLNALGEKNLPECSTFDPAALPDGKRIEITKIVIATAGSTPPQQPEGYLFRKYCGECHATDDIALLPLDSVQGMRDYKSDDGLTPLGMVTGHRMPPDFARLKLEGPDRDELLKLLRGQ